MVKNQLKSYTPEAAGMWNNFKRYFQVSNQYVVGKLKVRTTIRNLLML